VSTQGHQPLEEGRKSGQVEAVDHVAEAKRLIEADIPNEFGGRTQPYPYNPVEAQVRASLAIAWQLERLNGQLEQGAIEVIYGGETV
jgi:hypothetical protein